MVCEILLPYIDEDQDISVGQTINDFYSDDNSYLKALQATYGDFSVDDFTLPDLTPENPLIQNLTDGFIKNTTQTTYSKTNGYIFDMSGYELSPNEMDIYTRLSNKLKFNIKFDYESFDDNFESELKIWISETNKIKEYLDKVSLANNIENLPHKNLTIKFSYAEYLLENVLIEFFDEKNTLTIQTNKITKIK